jgi:hypothetical protein
MALVHQRVPNIATPIPHSLHSYSIGGAALAGFVGSLLFSGLFWFAQLSGFTNFSVSLYLGSLFLGEISANAALLGLGVHVLFGVLTAFIYAFIFHMWGWATWARGMAISVPHAIVAGLMLVPLSNMHPLTSEPIADPGFLGSAFGWLTPLILLTLFMIYGATVGAIYSKFVPHLSAEHPEAGRPAE